MGVTEPDDDVTELSSRKKAAEDATLLSARDSANSPDATVLSARQHPVAEADDDGTRLSPRTTADDTRVSPRSTPPRADASGRAKKAGPSALPPGVLGGAAAERGSFGQGPDEYSAREIGEPLAAAPAPVVAEPIPQPSMPDAERVRARREAARHRKLITTVIVVAATAALMTAAIIAIVALVRAA